MITLSVKLYRRTSIVLRELYCIKKRQNFIGYAVFLIDEISIHYSYLWYYNNSLRNCAGLFADNNPGATSKTVFAPMSPALAKRCTARA